MQPSVTIQADTDPEKVCDRIVRTLKAVGEVKAVDTQNAVVSGTMSNGGRRVHLKVYWFTYEGKTSLEVTGEAFEVGTYASGSAVERFIRNFRHIDEPGFIPNQDDLPDTLILVAVCSVLGLIIVGGVLFILYGSH